MNKSNITFKVIEPFVKDCGKWHTTIIVEKNGQAVEAMESDCFETREECIECARKLTFSLAEAVKKQMIEASQEKVEIMVLKDEIGQPSMPEMPNLTVH